MTATPISGTCACGHAASDHGDIDGFDCSPDVSIGGLTGVWDLKVCKGGRHIDSKLPDVSPWDTVCGCVLYPATDRNQRLVAERDALNA